MTHLRRQSGFTLVEVVIAVALIGIMAAAIGPVAIRQFNRAREDATLTEMELIRIGLQDYFDDIGAFPAEGTGLAALISDTGDANWRGPYLEYTSDNPIQAITTDAFGNPYIYDLNPSTTPADATDLLVASTGVNRIQQLGDDGTWTLADVSQFDDLIMLVSNASSNRAKRAETEKELLALSLATKRYYYNNGTFPGNLADLAPGYIDPGVGGNAFSDGWTKGYLSSISGGGTPLYTIWSGGENLSDDGGNGDDIKLEIDSSTLAQGEAGQEWDWTVEGNYSLFLVTTAQAALDANPGLALHGKKQELKEYLNALGLSNIFEHDDWGKKLQINSDNRQVYSSGPDGKKDTWDDNIYTGTP
ncbi:MAG: prepilin-type N-terminal cleavage/methylation domain-containing protein [bacterium]|nr:prepilin-type N-terminal cleavage/methylation domain-containing protein [bacterium]